MLQVSQVGEIPQTLGLGMGAGVQNRRGGVGAFFSPRRKGQHPTPLLFLPHLSISSEQSHVEDLGEIFTIKDRQSF